MDDFEVLNLLGEGSFSSVYKVLRKADGQEYAMKKVKMASLNKKEREAALNEIRILASVDHKNVIGYKEAFFEESEGKLCIVMEMADSGDLESKITQAKKIKSFVKESKIWYIFRELLEGLAALHSANIVHRDIKCANVFLLKNGGVKLGDMNVSKIATGGLMMTQTGTPYYCPPEVWEDKPYSSKCDIWSLGCVMYELAALKPPFTAKDMKGLHTKVCKGVFPRIPRHFSQTLQDILCRCLTLDPDHRSSAKQLLQLYPFNEDELESPSPKKPIITDQIARSRSQNPMVNDKNNGTNE